jgi:hypothetical protein
VAAKLKRPGIDLYVSAVNVMIAAYAFLCRDFLSGF